VKSPAGGRSSGGRMVHGVDGGPLVATQNGSIPMRLIRISSAL
jgi:hypothetical protein